MKLQIAQNHVGKNAARRYVIELCRRLKVTVPAKHASEAVLKFEVGNGIKKEIELNKEIEHVMKKGRADGLQIMHDSSDKFLNTPVSLGMMGDVDGIQAQLKSTYGDHTSSIQFPGVIEAPEVSFADDISFYRNEAVRYFNEEDLSGFSRSYRGYLLSCISVVDCFIHRYTFHVKSMIPDTQEYTNTAILDSRKSLDDRLEAWMTTFAFHRLQDLKESAEYCKFIELKRERNNIVHPQDPSVPYGMKQVVKYMNFAALGIGGLLANLRKYTGFTENIGFINQIKTEPPISTVKRKKGSNA